MGWEWDLCRYGNVFDGDLTMTGEAGNQQALAPDLGRFFADRVWISFGHDGSHP